MNRHERRKAQKVFSVERRTYTRADYDNLRFACAWEGCEACYTGEMPEGWRHLLVFWARHPMTHIADIPGDTWDRDTNICPAHAKELDGLLKNIGGAVMGPPAGSA
jgi:hypothetical protein